jgi:CRP/FNR family transcriptional regulator
MPITRSLKKCVDCNCKSLPFKELSIDELIQINRNRVELSFKKGDTIIKQGALAAHLVYIKSGLVKVFREQHNNEMVLSLEAKGKMLGLHAIHTKNIYPYSVVAYEDVTVCLVEISAIKILLETNAKFAAQMFSLLNEDALFIYDRLTCLTMKQIHGRFADLLLCMSLRIYKRKTFAVPLTKKDMAQIMNMSQESFSRVIKEFTDDKIIEFNTNQIKILNFEKVRNLSIYG